MKRIIKNIKIDDDYLKVAVLFYYDGLKELVSLQDEKLLVFYEYGEDYDLWFLIEPRYDSFEQFLSNKLTLLKLMLNENSKISLIKNSFDNINNFYDKRQICKIDLKNYYLPAENSLLCFDCLEEISLLKILIRNDEYINEN